MPTNVTGLPQVVAGPTVGVEAASPPNITQHKIAPTTTDYYNFNTGDLWLQSVPTNTTPVAGTLRAWMLAAKNANGQGQKTATWIPFFNGAAGSLVSLTGNTGGAVFGDANQNVNTIGDNVGIVVTGTPGNNTLTWSLVGGGQAIQRLQPAINGVPNGAAVTPIAGVLQINNTDANIIPVAGVPNPNNLNLNLANSVYITNNLLVGLTSPTNQFNPSVLDNGNINVYSATNGFIQIINMNPSSTTGAFDLIKQHGTPLAPTAINANDGIGAIQFFGYDGTNYIQAASIVSQNSGTVDANRVAGNLLFSTHPDSASGLVATLRMIIGTNGSITMTGQDAASVNPTLNVLNTSGGTAFTLNLGSTYGVPPGTPQDILVIDSAGNVGTGGAFATGTFTPTLTFSTSTGTITYVSQGGKYTQIGNVVYIAATVAVSSIGTSSGTMRMSGMPVTISTLVNTAQNVGCQLSGGITLTTGYSDLYGSGIAGTTSFTIDQEGSAQPTAPITDSNVSIGSGGNTSFTLTLSGFYFSS